MRKEFRTIVCQTCKETFETKYYERVYCSKSCSDIGRTHPTLEKTCACGKAYKTKKPDSKYCSIRCANRHMVKTQYRRTTTLTANLKQYAMDVTDILPTSDYTKLLSLHRKKQWNDINMLIRRVCKLKQAMEGIEI